jgi:hypothetical protein
MGPGKSGQKESSQLIRSIQRAATPIGHSTGCQKTLAAYHSEESKKQ